LASPYRRRSDRRPRDKADLGLAAAARQAPTRPPFERRVWPSLAARVSRQACCTPDRLGRTSRAGAPMATADTKCACRAWPSQKNSTSP